MSQYTQFDTSTPEVVEAIPEKVYDKYWLKIFTIIANNPTKPVRMRAVFVPARDVTIQVEGQDVTVKELKPDGIEKVVLINDLFGEAESDANLKSALEGVLSVLKTKGTEQGVF